LRYGPTARNYVRLQSPRWKEIYENELAKDLESRVDYESATLYEKKGLRDSKKVRFLAVRRCENGAPSQYCYYFYSKDIQCLRAKRIYEDDAYCLFKPLRAVPTEGTKTGFLWEAFCGWVIRTKSTLDVTKLGSTDRFIIPYMRTNHLYFLPASWPSQTSSTLARGYYSADFPLYDTYDAFCITEDNRVVFFKYVTKSDNKNGVVLSTSGFDDLAESLLKTADANLVPFDSRGRPKPGAEWRLVWVVPEKAKENVKAATFKPRTATTSQLGDSEKCEKDPPRYCQWDWASHVQQFAMGVDIEKGEKGLRFFK
jgi:hypothetical protein